jgi:hypothetical protein
MDQRCGGRRDVWASRLHRQFDPEAALGAGATLSGLLDGGVRRALDRTVRRGLVGPLRSATAPRLGLLWLGQHDADWIADYDVRRRVGGVRFGPGDDAELDLWAVIARSCGWWWPREGRCVIVERPMGLHVEPVPDTPVGEVRLHNADGPAVTFRDGHHGYAWHGTPVPAWVIEAPSAGLIGAERNIEVRRCAIERLGWDAFLEQAGLTLLGTAADPGNPGAELRLYELPYPQWGVSTRLLVAVNGSLERSGVRRRYGLRVPYWFDDPVDAAAWTYGLTGAQYAHLQRRT